MKMQRVGDGQAIGIGAPVRIRDFEDVKVGTVPGPGHVEKKIVVASWREKKLGNGKGIHFGGHRGLCAAWRPAVEYVKFRKTNHCQNLFLVWEVCLGRSKTGDERILNSWSVDGYGCDLCSEITGAQDCVADGGGGSWSFSNPKSGSRELSRCRELGKDSGGGGWNGGKGFVRWTLWGDGDGSYMNAGAVAAALGLKADDENDFILQSYTNNRPLTVLDLDAGVRHVCSGLEIVDENHVSLDVFSCLPQGCMGFEIGDSFTRSDLEAALSRVGEIGWFDYVEGWCLPGGGGFRIVIWVQNVKYPSVRECGIRGLPNSHAYAVGHAREATPCLFPKFGHLWFAQQVQSQGVTGEALKRVRDTVEKWYRARGYAFARVKNFSGLAEGELNCNVLEGVLTGVQVEFRDQDGQPVIGRTEVELILRQLPQALKVGMPFNTGAAREAEARIRKLQRFQSVRVMPLLNSEANVDDDSLVLGVDVCEHPMQSISVDSDFSYLSNEFGWPDLGTLYPGFNLSANHGTRGGINQSQHGSIGLRNALRPLDEMWVKLESLYPLNVNDPEKDSNRRSFRLSCFSKRKMSALVWKDRRTNRESPVWVDRAGVKATFHESFSSQNKASSSLVLEEVATRDEEGAICSPIPSSTLNTGSRYQQTGIDYALFLQTKVVRDNTGYINGMKVGARDVFQVDQGLSIGSTLPLFNRYELAMTRFLKFPMEIPADQPPVVTVFHARYAGCLGDLPGYQAFTKGGPYGLRGSNEGELVQGKHLVELVGEVQVPVKTIQVYGLVESGTDIQKLLTLRKHSGEMLKRIKKGTVVGAGLKVGMVRAEYLFECNSKIGTFKVCVGDRW